MNSASNERENLLNLLKLSYYLSIWSYIDETCTNFKSVPFLKLYASTDSEKILNRSEFVCPRLMTLPTPFSDGQIWQSAEAACLDHDTSQDQSLASSNQLGNQHSHILIQGN